MSHLLKEIDKKKKEISTDGYPMSIGELISLYKEGGLDVHPEFQRIFRWNILQKSKLIESILLGIPIPSVFVSQRKDGVWDVVDGQQRLSTIFEFVGVLKNSEGELIEPSKLVETKYLPSLKDVMWENSGSAEKEFSQDLRFIFKREKIDIKIVKRESDENVKFELFQRLNTLGTKLSDQEVRNCILVMIKPDFYTWLQELADYTSFKEVSSLAERLVDEQFNVELVLRFLILKNMNLEEIKSTQDLGEFITEKMINITTDKLFDLKLEEIEFKRTFDLLSQLLGSNAFKRYNLTKGKFEGSFILSAFEAIGLGLGRNIKLWDKITVDQKLIDKIEDSVKNLWNNPDYQSRSGSGVNVTRRVPYIIPLGQEVMKP